MCKIKWETSFHSNYIKHGSPKSNRREEEAKKPGRDNRKKLRKQKQMFPIYDSGFPPHSTLHSRFT